MILKRATTYNKNCMRHRMVRLRRRLDLEQRKIVEKSKRAEKKTGDKGDHEGKKERAETNQPVGPRTTQRNQEAKIVLQLKVAEPSLASSIAQT